MHVSPNTPPPIRQVSKIRSDFRRLWLPYCFQPMTDAINARHDMEAASAKDRLDLLNEYTPRDDIYPRARPRTYLPLNRRYKPLGMGGHKREWVDYLDYADRFVRFIIDPAKMKDVWFSSAGRGVYAPERGLYLYYDNPVTLESYGERYARLLNYLDIDWRDIRGDRRTHREMLDAGLIGVSLS